MKHNLLKKAAAVISAVAMTAQFAFVMPASAAEIYKQDFESVSDLSGLTALFPTVGEGGALKFNSGDETYGNYASYDFTGDDVKTKNSRGLDMRFTPEPETGNEYVVEFDASLKAGNNQNTQFVVESKDFEYNPDSKGKPSVNEGVKKGYLLKLDTLSGETWTINDVATSTVKLTSGEWYHYHLIVDKTKNLASLTITDKNGTPAIDKAVIGINGSSADVQGLYVRSGRYQGVTKLDNIVVRDKTDDDVFGETATETLSKIEFTKSLNKTITQPETAVHLPVEVKATGIYGGDLTKEDGIQIEWSVKGLDCGNGDDGYVSFTKEEGTGAGTGGVSLIGADADKTASLGYFNVRNGVSTYFGAIECKVTYLDETRTIYTPFAIIGADGENPNIAPPVGYFIDMDGYGDSLVGYKALSNEYDTGDLVLGNWSIIGSNGAKTLTLEKDDDETKYFRFASNSGSGSTVGTYALADQKSQYIADLKIRFTGGSGTIGHYVKTPNNGDNGAAWTCSYSGGTLSVGTESISGLNSNDWYRIVISADESTDILMVNVFNMQGDKVGSAETTLLSTKTSDQKYFCLSGTFPIDLASFKIYKPTAVTKAINTATDTIAVPETVGNMQIGTSDVYTYDYEGKTLTVNAEGADENTSVFAAVYKNNALSSIIKGKITIKDEKAVVENFELPDNSKLFVWNESDGQIKPLANEVPTYKDPNAGAMNVAELKASFKDANGFDITGDVTWEKDSTDENIVLTKTGPQTATLTALEGAPAGSVKVTARIGSAYAEKTFNLTTTGNSITFEKSSSSITIPFDGEDPVSGEYEAYTVDKDGEKVQFAVDAEGNSTQTPSTVTYTVLDKNSDDITNSMPAGITFGADHKLTVTSAAKPTTLYIKATNNDTPALSRTVKVNIHGLSFAFGSETPTDDSLTLVGKEAYSDSVGYGFVDASSLAVSANKVTGSSKYTFNAKVPNGNYSVAVNTTSSVIGSETVESSSIDKTEKTFKVAVCDGILDLTFDAASDLSSVTITQDAKKTANTKPAVYAIGDSTTNNNANGNISWGNRVNVTGGPTVPDVFLSFANHGMAGRNSASYYRQGRLESVLLSICPGDYVTVNMGINSETGEPYEKLMDEYYVQGILQRGGIPVIVTATPIGFSDKSYPYDAATGKFDVDRGAGARNGILRKIAQKYDLNIIELGHHFEDYFNGKEIKEEASSANTTVLDLVKSWYGDHNHYKQPLADKIGAYILDCLADIKGGSDAFDWEKDQYINER